MPGFSVSDGSLGLGLWADADLNRVESDYTQVVEAPGGRPVAPAPADGVTLANTTDATMTKLSVHGGDARYREVTGRARALGASLREDDPEAARVARELGFDLEDMAVDLEKMSALRLDREDERNRVPRPDLATCKKVLVALLRSDEFTARALRGGPISRAGVLALLNAGLGCLKMIQVGTATADSLFELVRGELYDITNASDVLKMSVRTALKVREMFIDAAGVNARAESAREAVREARRTGAIDAAMETRALERITEAARALIAARERLSAPLYFNFDVGDGSKKTVEAKLKAVRESLRAFRYDLDRQVHRHMDRRERARRWLDNIGRCQPTLTAEVLAPLQGLEGRFNRLLSEASAAIEPLPSVLSAERVDAMTDLSHTANNRIRYFFSGKEQRLEAFRRKAHKVLDGLVEKGGTRQVQFEIGIDAKAGREVLGPNAKAGVRYLRTATVTVAPGGGEITVTYSHGVDLSGEASFDLGLNDGDDAADWSAKDRTGNVLGGSLGGKANVSGSRTKTISYASLEDFIASLQGDGDLVNATAYKSMACLGRIGCFFRSVGRLVMKGLTVTGFRIAKSREDNATYVAKMRAANVMGETDRMIAHRENAVKTRQGTHWTFAGGGGVEGSLNFGSFNGTEKDDGGHETARKLNIVSGSVAGGITFERDAFVSVAEYGTLLEEARDHSDPWLRDQLDVLKARALPLDGRTESVCGLAAREDADEAELYRAIESALVALEDAAARLAPDAREWETFADTLHLLMVACVRLERRGFDTGALAERLAHPAVAIPADVYTRLLQRQTGVRDGGAFTRTIDFALDWDVGSDWVTDKSEKLAQAGMDKVGEHPEILDGLATVGGDVGAAGVNATTSTALGIQSANIRGKWSVRKPVTADNVCPWLNSTVETVTIGITPGLTTRLFVEFLARKYVDQLTDIPDDQKPDLVDQVRGDWSGALQETVGTAALAGFWDLGVEELAKRSSAFAALFASPTDVTGSGFEAGLDTDYQKSFNFTIVDGRLAGITVDETTKVGSSVGARVEVLPSVSVGSHIKDTLTTVEIDRYAVVRPNLDILMGRAEAFVRTGNREGFRNLLAHNKPGALRLFRVMSNLPVAGDDPRFEEDCTAFSRRLAEVRGILRQVAARRDANLTDRVGRLRERLAEALRLRDAAADDAEKLAAVDELTCVMTETFLLAREAGDFWRGRENEVRFV